MKYSENALAIYKRLYFDTDESRPEQVHDRVAKRIANDEGEFINFRNMLDDNIFRPNTPCLINAGREGKNKHNHQYCACFVLGLEDSMESIIRMWEICSKIYASGAGAGIPITNLRPKGFPISAGGQASGPLAYLQVVDAISNTVKSGGRTRRAASISCFRHDHPDIMEILESKNSGQFQNFNISMVVDNDFMTSIEKWKRNKKYEIDMIGLKFNNDVYSEIDPTKLWDKLTNNAWKTGDPGLLFYDTVNDFNPFPSLGEINCTNPCGEISLPPWSVCNLGSLNLNNIFGKNLEDGFEKFDSYVYWAMQFLDNVIDKTQYLSEEFEYNSKLYRPTGLGIMGLADLFYKLKIGYDSHQTALIFKILCQRLTHQAIKSSILMVKQGKKPIDIPRQDYDHFEGLLKYYTNKDEQVLKDFKKYGIRNSTWTCIAPTGSTSMSADCSYAWEPHMALIWKKKLTDSDQVLNIINPQFEKEIPEISRISKRSKEQIIQDICNHKGSIQHIDYIPDVVKNVYVVAHDIDPLFKIKMQGMGQMYISLAISATCNLPSSATVEDIGNIYLAAWKNGLKGITIYRDGCHENQVIDFGGKKDEKVIPVSNEIPIEIKSDFKRPIKRHGDTFEIKTPHGNLFITCNKDKYDRPFELFF
jgi:ribonucleoside-diphosphate reductase alpha chain